MIKRALSIFLLLACIPFAQASDQLLNSLQPRGFVSDFANVISSSDEQQLTSMITELRQKTGAEIAVVTLQSLEDGEIDDFTNRLYEKWGIGQKGKDNGLMFLAAMKERKMRIEVGYGLEGAIPDAKAGRIRRDVITPYFKAGSPGKGIVAGIAALSLEVAKEYGVTLTGAATRYQTSPRSSNGRKGNPFVTLILAIFFIIFAIRHPHLAMLLLLSGGRGGGYSSGGGGGFSGGGGFGGGMSGGGGSSGGW
jgi:uncharacterized protein